MIVAELLNNITQNSDYVFHSLFLKSSDNSGCVYKYLLKSGNIATRKEIFIELDESESQLSLEDKTVLYYIEVSPAR